MSKKRTSKKRTKKQKLLSTFIRASVITLFMCVILGGGVAWAYQTFIHDGESGSSWIDTMKPTKDTKEEKVNKTVAVLGTDIDGYRTDVIFLVNFNSETNQVKVVSIPRDTRVEWSGEQQDAMRREKGYSKEVSKINEMTAYVGIENVRAYTIAQIEAMLGVKVDNYVVVTLDSFRKIVDAIGGVYVDVPMRMYYKDSSQGLYIDLEQGPQLLDGEKAEMLVRYRKGYTEGDVGRIATQQLFLEAFAEKVLSPTIITKIPQMISVLFSSVTTDVELSEILPYYSYVKEFNQENIEFGVIPGEGKYIGNVSYFIPDMDEMDMFIQDMFFDNGLEAEASGDTGSEEVRINKNVSIEVLNASGISGAASKARDMLEAEGYEVDNVGNYTESSLNLTKIVAKDIKDAEQFKAYYPDAEIVEDDKLAFDIQILLVK